MGTMWVEVVTPERKVVGRECTMVSVRALDGEIGILPGHIPLVTVIVPGVLRIKDEQGEQRIALSAGFLEVGADHKVIILAETAELSSEIDVERARRAKTRAEERLAQKGNPEIDFVRNEMALRKAIARIRAVDRDE
ncbi:MAG: F0F1 ATP synthase subunit epsilon [Thermaerobacter sp.]|nr:F0F1 ATP synthase subunit epsilon [Thermaerobacter sp.]